MVVVQLSDDGTIALPKETRRSLSLRSGDRLEVSVEAGGIRLVPAARPKGDIGRDISGWIGTGTSFSSPSEVDDFVRAERDRWD